MFQDVSRRPGLVAWIMGLLLYMSTPLFAQGTQSPGGGAHTTSPAAQQGTGGAGTTTVPRPDFSQPRTNRGVPGSNPSPSRGVAPRQTTAPGQTTTPGTNPGTMKRSNTGTNLPNRTQGNSTGPNTTASPTPIPPEHDRTSMSGSPDLDEARREKQWMQSN
jgi:hypothetical protein